ncbi:14673_t:CDS:2, partial [Dentiscutata heterogama]
TARHYDYPFIIFHKENIPRIYPSNSPWNNILQDSETEFVPDSEISSSYSIITSISKHYIITDNIENNKLYEVYTTLKKPLIAETTACNKVLNAKTQQQTWDKSKIGKLAFWLQ